MKIGVIIPARDEVSCVAGVVGDCLSERAAGDAMRVVVCDNGSTDDTAAVARRAGAEVVHERMRGYGAACLCAIEHLADWPDVFLFVDGDGSCDCTKFDELLDPLRQDLADLVIGWRFPETGAMTWPQRIGSRLFSGLVALRWGVTSHDLGPCRAITRRALEELAMRDRTWGWTLEMQIKAVVRGLRVVEVPVRWRRRRSGRSKISGTFGGALRACSKISVTFARYMFCPRKSPRRGRDLVVACAKFPEPGCVKTRLAETVGDQRAASVYGRLAERCHRQMIALQSRGLADAAIYGTGRAMSAFRKWLPGARYYWAQPVGDLTPRLQTAFEKGFATGADRVAAVGTDCPTLDAGAIARALGALREADVAIIPNTDGGYALIGLKQNQPQLFEGIAWSTPWVLEQTRRRAAELGLSVSELQALPDVDTAADLRFLPPLISIIMPAFNEEPVLRRNLPRLMQQIADQPETIELIVVDGGSRDASVEVARDCGATVIASAKGRGRQMNAGTALARGEWVWYLHADCVVADGGVREICVSTRRHFFRDWGYLRARIDAPGPVFKLISWGINLRSRWLRLPYGDQGLFVRSEIMQQSGGFIESQLLEDVDLVRRLANIGRPIRVASRVLINARKWRQLGAWGTTLMNWRIVFDYLVLGKDIRDIAGRYDAIAKPYQPFDVPRQEGAVSR